MEIIKGPDFPTGGIIQGIEGIKKHIKQEKVELSFAAKRQLKNSRWPRTNCH